MTSENVVVIGGGVAGAAAASRLVSRGFKVTLVEKGGYIGGRIRSDILDGIPIEGGAQFLTNFYSNTLALVDAVGLRSHLREIERDIALAKGGNMIPLISLATFTGSRVLSVGAKLRLVRGAAPVLLNWSALDFHNMARAASLDRSSVLDAWHDRLGKEVSENIIAPALDGFLYWLPRSTSNGMLLILLKAATKLHTMYSLEGGLQSLIEKLVEGVDVKLKHEVMKVVDDGHSCRVIVRGAEGEFTVRASGVVCATPATAVSSIFDQLKPTHRQFFSSISYSSTVSVACAVSRTVDVSTSATMLAAGSNLPLAMINVLSRSGRNKTLVGRDVISLFASGSVGKALCVLDDDAIYARLSQAATDVSNAFDCEIDQTGRMVYRWPLALPEFGPGYLRSLQEYGPQIDNGRIAFAGDYLGGPFIEGAVTSGLQAAENLAAHLGRVQ